jgi:Spy/CpxP family protein refolding chaperone
MADQGKSIADSSASGGSGQYRPAGRKGILLVTLIALFSGLTGALATTVFGQGPGYGYWHGEPWFGHRSEDPATIDQRIERAIKHMAIEIDATKEQQDKIITIAKMTVKELQPLREKMQGGRMQAIDLLTQPTIDRSAIEKFRADQLATADEISKRIATAIADVANILTPEQRKVIADRLPYLGGWHHHWHRS